MFIPDGSDIDYDDHNSEPKIKNRYSWGWIEDKVPPENRGWKDLKLKEQVLNILREKKKQHTVMHHMGHHDCGICRKNNEGMNGSFIIKHESLEFRCPAGVAHYIEVHNYNPGSNVIEALFKGKWKTYSMERFEIINDAVFDATGKKEAEEEKERNMTPAEREERDHSIKMQKAGRDKLAQLQKDKAIVGIV